MYLEELIFLILLVVAIALYRNYKGQPYPAIRTAGGKIKKRERDITERK